MAKDDDKWLKNKKLLIVAHGDLDGIFSAVLVIIELHSLYSESIRVEFAQPFGLDKITLRDDEDVVVVDIAVNNRNPQMTRDFIDRLGDKLFLWFDHHQGWDDFLFLKIRSQLPSFMKKKVIVKDNFIIDDSAPSCANLLAHVFYEREPIGLCGQLMVDATVADTRQGQLSPRADFIERAIKADLSDDNVRKAALWWILGDESQLPFLEVAVKKYVTIQAETERLATTYQVTDNKVALVNARDASRDDLTQLLLAGQRVALFAVIQTTTPGGDQNVTIATSRKDVNLVDVFGLPSGAPSRVTLPADKLEDALKKLNSL